MRSVKYFKAARKTPRWNQNQKVWVSLLCANHIWVWYKYRGSGRYVGGIVDRHSSSVGEIKEIEVDDGFAERIEDRRF